MSHTVKYFDGKKRTEKEDSFKERAKAEGCTAAIVLIAKGKIYCANAGDSRTVLNRGGKAIDMSADHKPDDPKEKARVEKAGGIVMRGRVDVVLACSRSIGDQQFKDSTDESKNLLPPEEQKVSAEPDIDIKELTKDDRFLVIACDGLWDCRSSQECVDELEKRFDAR